MTALSREHACKFNFNLAHLYPLNANPELTGFNLVAHLNLYSVINQRLNGATQTKD